MMAKAKKVVHTEVDAYGFIKRELKNKGWDTRNPSSSTGGQVYTQNEFRSDEEIVRWLGQKTPENIVVVNPNTLWVIEAKRSHGQIREAVDQATEYARLLNQSKQFQARFISGVAGNDQDFYVIETYYYDGADFVLITINGVAATALLTPDEARTVLSTNSAQIEETQVDEKLFLSQAERINEILHKGAVNPHQRASVMAALLLSTISETQPNVDAEPTILIDEINSRVETILERQRKREFISDIQIQRPGTTDNHIKLKGALVDTLKALNTLNIRSAMRSGSDWLGTFYEVFLKYASWAQDLGIVLTPRHITQYVADVMDIQPGDIVYDPTCGTGGFLVAALDYVKRHADIAQIERFKQHAVFGIEQDSGVASLAVVNMIFRGDGKNNIIEGNCFARILEQTVQRGVPTAEYVSSSQDRSMPQSPPITKVMMNPPFSLPRSDEKEYKFVDHALAQMQRGGLLFCILPYPAMVKPRGYKTWRRDILLKQHTLLAVMTLPIDLFYPVGVTSVGVFIRKGIPHPTHQNVLWIRALHDGLLKSKKKRLPNDRATNDLAKVKDTLKAFLRNPNHPVPTIRQLQQAAPIDFDDKLLELVPENYLEQDQPTEDEIRVGIEQVVRDAVAYMIQAGLGND